MGSSTLKTSLVISKLKNLFEEVKLPQMIQVFTTMHQNVWFYSWPAWLRWLDHRLLQQKVEGSVPDHSAWGRQLTGVSLSCQCFCLPPSLFLPLSLSLKSTDTFLKDWF